MDALEAMVGLRELADALPFDVWVRDRRDVCVYANPIAQQHWPGLVGSAPPATDVSEQVRDVWLDNNRRARGGEVVRGEVRYPHGSFINIISPVHHDEEVVGTVGINIEISAQRRAEQASRRTEKVLALLCEQAPAVIGIRKLEGDRITHVYDNQVAARLFERMPDELVGMDEAQLGVDANVIARAAARFRASAEQGTSAFEMSVPTRCGERVLAGSVTPIDWDDDAGETYAVVAQDVTERRVLEARAMRSDRLANLATVVETVGHELANPATPALMSLEELEADLQSWVQPGYRDEVGDVLRTAIFSVRQMLAVAEDVRALTRISRSEEPIALAQVVEAVTRLVRRGHVALELELGDVPTVSGHRVQLAQLLLNLVKNAFEAFEPPRPGRDRVVLRTRQEGAEVVVEVEDNGPGVAADVDEETLFGAFVTTKADHGGTGLGLYLCRHIATSHGGSIHHERPEAGGARFVVRLPTAEAS